jgi:hypothetical protein
VRLADRSHLTIPAAASSPKTLICVIESKAKYQFHVLGAKNIEFALHEQSRQSVRGFRSEVAPPIYVSGPTHGSRGGSKVPRMIPGYASSSGVDGIVQFPLLEASLK